MKQGELLGKMLAFAANAHLGQFDKGGNPYFLHPLAVMKIVASTDEEINCIALGHDLLEDTDTTIQDLIGIGMTTRVIQGIMALTKMPGQTYEGYKEAVKANKDAVIVKMADLRHNSDFTRLKGVSDKDTARMVKYMKFYSELSKL